MKLSAADLTQQLALAQQNAALADALRARATCSESRKTVERLAREARSAARFFQGALLGLAAA
jgi:hypothetical protein